MQHIRKSSLPQRGGRGAGMKNRNSRRADGIGAGAFAAAALSEDEFRNAFRVVPVGEIAEIRESFYAISRERRIKHPAVAVVLSAAAAA